MMHILYACFTTALLLLLLPTTLHSADIRFLESLSTNHTKDDPMGFIIVPGYRSNAHHFLLGQIEHANVGFVNCIEICRTNAKCMAVTFLVGKCLLYGRDGVDGTTKGTSFSFYGQKIVLPKMTAPCSGPWNFEMLPNFRFSEPIKRELTNVTLADCLEACTQEADFKCKSMNFKSDTGTCELLEVDRNSLDKLDRLEDSEEFDYYENSCMAEPRQLCDVKKVNGQKLAAVDDLFENVENRTACEQLCLTANFRCNYYEYSGTKSKICRISHLNQKTAVHLEHPYTQVSRKKATYEVNVCYDIKIECSKDGILTKVTSSQLFNGIFYSYGAAHSCAAIGNSNYNFQLNMTYTDLSCNLFRMAEDSYEVKLFIQQHRNFVTSSDKSLAVACKYQIQNRTIQNDVDITDRLEGPSVHLSEYLKAPPIRMSVVRRQAENQSVHDIQVGDELTIRIEFLEEDSNYDLFVRHLIATDATNLYELELIDADGCPEEEDIMGAAYRKKKDSRKLRLDFDAFKFPSSDLVIFRAVISMCLKECKASRCKSQDGKKERMSYGRKRRRRRESLVDPDIEAQIVHDVVFTETIRVQDKAINERRREFRSRSEVPRRESILEREFCVQHYGFLLALPLFLIGQLVTIAAFESFVYLEKRKTSRCL